MTASIASITQVLSPNFSKVKTRAEIFKELWHGMTYLFVPILLFIVIYFLPNQVFYLFFTQKFAKTAAITKALSLPYIIYVFMNIPILFLLYTVKKPGVILLANVAVFIIVSVGCYFLIPKFGIFGPPYALAAAFFVSFLIMTVASVSEYRKIS